MNTIKIASVAALATACAASVCAQEAVSAPPPPPQRIVVSIDKFDDTDGSNADNAAHLRERVLHRVVGTRKFEVVERADLLKVLSEIRNADAGLTDESMAPERGRLKAAGYVIYGKLLFVGVDAAAANVVGLSAARARCKAELQVKISNAETGRILASKIVVGRGGATSVTTPGISEKSSSSGDPMFRDAIDNAAALAVDALRDLCYPAKIVRVDSRYATINMTSEEVGEGDVFNIFEDAGTIIDPDTGVSLGNDGAFLGRVRVVIPGAMTSKVEPIDGIDISRLNVGSIVRRTAPLPKPRPKPIDDRF